MSKTTTSSELRIKQAAIKVFTNKGLTGARMQDIADEAGINKAMLHYYFRSKQQLFELVFAEKLNEMFSAFRVILDSEHSFEEKIRSFVSTQIDLISRFPELPMFVLEEVRKNPAMLEERFAEGGPKFLQSMFHEMVDAEVAAGRMRPMRFEQFLVNLMSLSMYPFVAKPVIQFVLDMDDTAFVQLMQERKKLVADLLLNDVKIKPVP